LLRCARNDDVSLRALYAPAPPSLSHLYANQRIPSALSCNKECVMDDVVAILAGVAIFALLLLYIPACEKV
jgi:hypothetical protein